MAKKKKSSEEKNTNKPRAAVEVDITPPYTTAGNEGGIPYTATAVLEPSAEEVSRESRAQAANRWSRERRRPEADRFREGVRLECQAAGMSRYDSVAHSWVATIAAFPPEGRPAVTLPLPAPPKPPESPSPSPEAGHVQGLGRIPKDWPDLPPNASLQAELAWVQANRLSIVGQASSGAAVVSLDKARSPAPSMAALGWLETSIRSYAKYVDVLARAMGTSVDEVEHVRRERASIEEIRALLREMRQ